MQEQETSKGSALTLTLEFDEVVDLAQELREAKAALLDWKKQRKDKCQTVRFEISGPDKEHAEAEKMLERLRKDKAEPGPFLQSLKVEVALLNAKGKKVKEFVLGDHAAPPAPKDDEDDEKGSYGLVENTQNITMEEATKKAAPKKDEPKKKRTLVKTQIQFANQWQIVQFPFVLFIVGCVIWGLSWALESYVLTLESKAKFDYNEFAKEVLGGYQDENEEIDAVLGEKPKVNIIPFAIGCIVGSEKVDTGKMLFIVSAVLGIAQHAVWLLAYFTLLAAPDRFGSRGQAMGLVALGITNIVLFLVFRLLPLLGVSSFTSLFYLVPEWSMSNANMERTLPLPVFWSERPFWSFLFGTLFAITEFAEPALFCIYLHHLGISIQNDRVRDKGLSLTQLACGMGFITFAYYCMAVAGTTGVMILLMKITFLLRHGFLIWFLNWAGLVVHRARADVAEILTEKDLTESGTEDDEEDEDEDEDEEDEEDEDEDEDDEDEEDEDEDEDEDERPRRRARR
jgi:hypothetical protein